MSLSSFAYSISLLWLIIYILHYVVVKRRETRSILPLDNRGLQRTREPAAFHVVLRLFQVRIETAKWNDLHDKLATSLSKRRRVQLRLTVERFYGLGYFLSMLGMVFAFGLLVWTTWVYMKLYATFNPSNPAGDSESVGRLMKRDSYTDSIVEGQSAALVKPILPGVTVPLNHLPVIVMALFFCQVIHELGHAISAALYSIPILSLGASLTVCIPAAFVSFSTASVDMLRPALRSRIVSAGPFHNFVFWLLWFLVGFTSKPLMTIVGYKDVSSIGRVVTNIDEDSPLFGSLSPGVLITKLNDQTIASSETDVDTWSNYLTSPKADESTFGWCVDEHSLANSSHECCLPDEALDRACFVANISPNQIGCLDPVPILSSNHPRCTTRDDCQTNDLCVRPAEKERLVRLTIEDNLERIVLWSGSRQEIWQEVSVGIWQPRFAFLPLSLPYWASVFWEYISIINLSLFLFNLLPLPGLDGSHLLHTILAAAVGEGNESYNMDALERAESASSPYLGSKRRLHTAVVERSISGLTSLLFVFTVIFAIVGTMKS